jgi:hypothetical protein
MALGQAVTEDPCDLIFQQLCAGIRDGALFTFKGVHCTMHQSIDKLS